jgi:ADP-heptose:LPS heptosyltransferase
MNVIDFFLIIPLFFYLKIKKHFIKKQHFNTVIVNLAGGIGDMILMEPFVRQYDLPNNLFITYAHTAEYLKCFIRHADFLIIDKANKLNDIKKLKIACDTLLVPKDDIEAHLTAAIIDSPLKKHLLKAYSNPIFNKKTKFIYDKRSIERPILGFKSPQFHIFKTHLFLSIFYWVFIRLNYHQILFSYKRHYLQSFEEFFKEQNNFFYQKSFKGNNIIIVCPFASIQDRNIELEKLIYIATQHQKFTFIFVGKGSIQPYETKLLASRNNIKNLINQTSFDDLFQLYEQADYYIGSDTALAHLAMKYQLKTLVVLNNTSALHLFYDYQNPLLELFPLFETYEGKDVFEFNIYDIRLLDTDILSKKVSEFLNDSPNRETNL